MDKNLRDDMPVSRTIQRLFQFISAKIAQLIQTVGANPAQITLHPPKRMFTTRAGSLFSLKNILSILQHQRPITVDNYHKYLHSRGRSRVSWGCSTGRLWLYCAFPAPQPAFPSPFRKTPIKRRQLDQELLKNIPPARCSCPTSK